MLNTGLAGWPDYSQDEIDAAAAVLRSGRVNYWTGDEARQFELEFAACAGTAYAIALANGTVALDLALKALGIGPGDDVIVTPRTFIASVSTVVNAGARPIFADVDPDSGNITAESIEAVLTPRSRAVIPVHLGGWPCSMTEIMALADATNLKVIEDCAQAHGALHAGRCIGSFGDVGAWSFCQDKILTTGGEGGAVTTNDEQLWRAMWAFKDHGKSWEAVYERQHPPGFRWLHESFGTNWRMLEVQAAIARMQLRKLQLWSERRAINAGRIRTALKAYPEAVRLPEPSGGDKHAWYRCYAYVRPQGLRDGWSRDRVVEAIVARGVPALQGSCSEVYLERAFEGTGFRPRHRLPVARELGETSLAFLVHPTLTDEDLDRMCEAIDAVFREASR